MAPSIRWQTVLISALLFVGVFVVSTQAQDAPSRSDLIELSQASVASDWSELSIWDDEADLFDEHHDDFLSLLAPEDGDEDEKAPKKKKPQRPPRCKFQLSGQEFDFCPLFTGERAKRPKWIGFDVQTPPTVTHTQYRISLLRRLGLNATKPAHEQCPDGTFICMIVSNRRPAHKNEAARVTQVVPVAGTIPLHPQHNHNRTTNPNLFTKLNVTARVAGKADEIHGAVQFRYRGGLWANKTQQALISFVCDHNKEEPSYPTYRWSWNGTHAFRWETKAACGTRLANSPDPKPDPAPDRSPERPPQPGEGDEQEIYNPDPEIGTGVGTAGKVGGVFAMLLIIGAVVTLVLNARLRTRVIDMLRDAKSSFSGYSPLSSSGGGGGYGSGLINFAASRVPVLLYLVRRAGTSVSANMSQVPVVGKFVGKRRGSGGWSDEDTAHFLAFDAEEEGGEEMVNGRRPVDDEQIPLAPSPRQSTFPPRTVSYGAAG